MQTLSTQQTQQASGGILWTTPALVALADTGSLGPLAFAFSMGFGIGTLIYNNFISE